MLKKLSPEIIFDTILFLNNLQTESFIPSTFFPTFCPVCSLLNERGLVRISKRLGGLQHEKCVANRQSSMPRTLMKTDSPSFNVVKRKINHG